MKSRVFIVLAALACDFMSVSAQTEIFVQNLLSVSAFDTSVVAGTTAGSNVAVTSAARGLKILTGPQLNVTFTYPVLPNDLASLAFTRDRQLITARQDGQINVWDPVSGTMLKSTTGHASGITECSVYPDGRLLLAGPDNTVSVFDAASSTEVLSLSLESDQTTAIAVHPDGKIAVVTTNSNKLLVLDSALTVMQTIVEARETATALAFSPDGAYLATGGVDGTLRLWDVATWTLAKTGTVQTANIRSLGFDPQSRWIASAADDSTLVIYDRATLNPVKKLREPGAEPTFVSFTSPESMVSSDSRGRVTRWRVLEHAPDTTAPTLTILQPSRFSREAPTKIYAPSYKVFGVVYDESAIRGVTIGSQKAVLSEPKVQNVAATEAGLKGMEFSALVNLAATGLNLVEVKATDAEGNSSIQPLYIERLSSSEALEIISPIANEETDKVAVDVHFKPWFDIASYTISANTVDLIKKRGPFKAKPGDVVKEEVPLIVGYNQISVSVVSKQGERFTKLIGVNRKFSAAVTEAIRRPVPKGATGPQRWAVIVGVSDYANKGIPALKYADKDAESIAAFLQTPEGGSFDRDHMRILINSDATLSNLREAMIDFLQQAIDKDLVLIYFAGHGAPDPTRPQNLYLLTYDTDPNRLGTTAFPMWDIQTVVSRQIAARKVVILSDACHSGGISVDVATRGLDVTSSNPINQYLAELSRAKDGMVVFTASAAGEVSQEFPELGHGVFTYYLLEGLKGAADLNNDYVVTVNELMGYVEEQVKRKTRGAQNPTRSQTTYDKELPMAVINK